MRQIPTHTHRHSYVDIWEWMNSLPNFFPSFFDTTNIYTQTQRHDYDECFNRKNLVCWGIEVLR